MYLKFKELGVFEDLKKKKPINYDDVPIKFKAWKDKMGYTNAQCAEILNVSVPNPTAIRNVLTDTTGSINRPECELILSSAML